MKSVELNIEAILLESMDTLSNYRIFIGNPKKEIPQQYVYQCTKLLNKFDNKDLKKELFNSKVLALAVDKTNKTVISCASLRVPREKRKERIFDLANSSEIIDEYKYELSNLYTHPNYRNQGVLKYLVHRTLINRNGRGETVYALSNLDFVTNMLVNYFGFETIEDINYNDKNLTLLGLV